MRLAWWVSLSCCVLPLAAQRSVLGTWRGDLDAGGVKLPLVLHLTEARGALQGKLDSPEQGATGIPIRTVEFEDGKLALALPALNASYAGSVDAAGEKITGVWTQGGAKLPLVFERRGPAPAPGRPQMPEPPFPYAIEAVAYSYVPSRGVADSFEPNAGDGDGRISFGATLTVPEGEGPHPAAVLVSGSGPQDRDETLQGHKPFWVLADFLTRRGIAVLRYDDRGVGQSTGDFAAATSDDFAQDALASVHFLRSRDDIEGDAIGIIGHSEGGLIAPIVASDPDNRVAFIVMLAGPGVNGKAIIELQSREIAIASGADPAEIDRQLAVQTRMLEVVVAEPDVEKARKRLTEIASAEWDRRPEDQRGGHKGTVVKAQVDRLLGTWMRHFLRYDPVPALRKVDCPVLAVNGDLDLQVVPSQNLPPIEKALLEGGNPDHTVIVLPELNHLFQRAKTGAPSEYREIEETMSPVLLKTVGDWIAKRFL